MKKIFAIALALVMVLSMASAFASQCTTGFDWTKAADPNKCGKVTVEVVPYIKVNDGCGGFKWEVSKCAGAVNSENVHFALKMTADANLDAEWLAKAELKMGLSGLKDNVVKDKQSIGMNGVDTTKDKQVVYYLNNNQTAWVDETADTFAIKDFIFTNKVTDASKAKVCATLKSENAFTEGVVGDYYVMYSAETATDWAKIEVFSKKGGTLLVTYTIKDDKIFRIDYTQACGEAQYATIRAFFGLDIGTTVTAKLIKKNFGWADEAKVCFQWNKDAVAIANAECQVAIPKTGDVSVVAYAVMALVAAAGAMGLKK